MEFSCLLCAKKLVNHHDRYLVEGNSKVNVKFELDSLSRDYDHRSKYICKSCRQQLAKRRSLIEQQERLEKEIKSHLNNSSLKRSSLDEVTECETPKKIRSDDAFLTSTPSTRSVPVPFPNITLAGVFPCDDHPSSSERISTNVSVKIKWASKEKERKLPEDLEPLGKMLARGTYKQIANAAWKCSALKKEITALVIKDVEKEATKLCSKKDPICLRKTDKKSMLSFSMDTLEGEIKEKAPLLHSCFTAAAINSRSRARNAAEFGAVGMAAAVCLRNRSKSMIAVQLMITTFLYHSSWMVS